MTKVRELLSDESKWTKGAFGSTSPNGEKLCSKDPRATCWCLSGAINKCYGSEASEIYRMFSSRIPSFHIIEWNDLPTTTFPMVKALVEELDI